MYLKIQHFQEIMQDNRIDIKNDLFQFSRLSSKAAMFGTGSSLYIIYCNTIVFAYSGGQVLLNSDGWHTNTTKKWINYGFDKIYSGKYISQKNWQWFVCDRDGLKMPFTDLMVLNK